MEKHKLLLLWSRTGKITHKRLEEEVGLGGPDRTKPQQPPKKPYPESALVSCVRKLVAVLGSYRLCIALFFCSFSYYGLTGNIGVT